MYQIASLRRLSVTDHTPEKRRFYREFIGLPWRRYYALDMADNSIPGAMLGHGFPLEGGARARLRLARSSDARVISSLLAREPALDGVAALDLVRFDPRDRYVICATALIDGSEQMVGLGAIDLDGDEVAEPDLLIVDPELAGALDGPMRHVLISIAEAAHRARAA